MGIAADTRRELAARRDRTLVVVAVFFTNLLSLACQVIWGRELAYLFGSTAAVFATVLAVFLLGLACGALLGGRWADRSERPWLLLGRLELLLGVYVFLSLAVFEVGRSLYLAVFPASMTPLAAALAKLLVVLVVMVTPPFLIGAAFSIAVRIYSEKLGRLGHDVSLVYGADTLGAACGALLAGFWLVPELGLATSTRLLGGAALVLGGLILWREARRQPVKRKKEKAREAETEDVPLPAPRLGALLAAYFASGAAALLLETGWNRFFSLLNGTHVYSTATVLAGFLLGIGLGSLAVARWSDRFKDPSGWVALFFAAITLAGMLVFRSAEPFSRVYLLLFAWSESYYLFQLAVCLVIGLVVVVSTLAMGANFPLVAKLATRAGGERGFAVGRVFFVNTLGAVCGALLGELVLLPAWGFAGLAVAVLVLAGGAAAVFLGAAKGPRLRLACAGLLVAAVLVSPAVWPLEPPIHALYYHGLRAGDWERYSAERSALEVVEARQGFYGQVAVARLGPDLLLKHNGKTDASTNLRDNKTQILLGHLPLLFHPEPEKVLAIGLGGGLTLRAITNHEEPREIVMVEIDPLVVEMARRHFADYVAGAFDDPRVEVVTNDGRNYVEATDRRFDVITSEPPNIWVAGVSGLFTEELYRAASDRLEPGGILCQWVPLYELEREDFRVMLHTITTVFPHVAFWQLGGDLVILASSTRFAPSLEKVSARLRQPEVERDFAEIGMTVDDALRLLNEPVVRPDQVGTFLGEVDTLNTDDRPVLEFRTARNLFTLAKDGS